MWMSKKQQIYIIIIWLSWLLLLLLLAVVVAFVILNQFDQWNEFLQKPQHKYTVKKCWVVFCYYMALTYLSIEDLLEMDFVEA